MFIQSCFIRNVSKLLVRDIRVLGYEPMYDVWHYNVKGNNLVLENNTWHFTNSDNHPNSIDCGENKDLFLAIAALRDDTDENQWFIVDIDVYLNLNKGDWFKATNINGQYHVGTKIDPLYCHKATVEELIEYFKNI